jgi:hypothetical protein
MKTLFSLFHDFEIIDLTKKEESFSVKLELPWGELWDEFDYFILLNLIDCRNLAFTWFNQTKNIQQTVEGIDDILNLKLSIQSYRFTDPGNHTFFCNSNESHFTGELSFISSDYILLDKNNKHLELDKMQEWAKLWWKNINDMWEDQSKNQQ